MTEVELAPGAALVVFATLDEVPDDDAWLDPRERAVVATLHVPKRRADYRLGRWAAKRALTEVFGVGRVTAVLPDDRGAPCAWLDDARAPWAISLSHAGGLGACAITPDAPRDGALVGVDVETIETRSQSFVESYFTDAERRVIARDADPDLVATTIWSAKESALKALGVGLREDTRDVEITLALPLDARGWGRFEARHASDTRFPGLFRRVGGAVLTLVGRPPIERVDLRGARA